MTMCYRIFLEEFTVSHLIILLTLNKSKYYVTKPVKLTIDFHSSKQADQDKFQLACKENYSFS